MSQIRCEVCGESYEDVIVWRVTVHTDAFTLHAVADTSFDGLKAFAKVMSPIGKVIASPYHDKDLEEL